MVSRVLFALLFVGWVGEWPREVDGVMYSGLWRSPFVVFAPLFSSVPGIRLLPWQLILFALIPICVGASGAFRNRARAMDVAILVSLACVAVTFLWGWFRGGSPYHAYYQVWRFLTALLVGFMLMSVVRSPRDLRVLALTIIVAALIRASLVIYFYWVHLRGKVYPMPEYVTNHDDSLLFVTALLIVGSWALVTGRRRAWSVSIGVALYLLYAMALNERRIAWVELAMAMIGIYVLIGASPLRRRIHRWAIVAAPIVAAYVVVGWGSEGALFAPIHALSSAGSDYDPSSLARQEEVRNLLYTMSQSGNPLLGTGWGVPYQKLTSIFANYSADWLLALYTPHNSLLGLATFAGLVGVLGIWCVVPVAAYLAAVGYRKADSHVRRTAAMVAIGTLVAYSVHCFGDIGLQSFPCGLILGAAIATAGRLAAWNTAPTMAVAGPRPVARQNTTFVAPPVIPVTNPRGAPDQNASPRSLSMPGRSAAYPATQKSARRPRS